VVRGNSMGPTDGTRSEKVWEPLALELVKLHWLCKDNWRCFYRNRFLSRIKSADDEAIWNQLVFQRTRHV